MNLFDVPDNLDKLSAPSDGPVDYYDLGYGAAMEVVKEFAEHYDEVQIPPPFPVDCGENDEFYAGVKAYYSTLSYD